MIIILTPRKTMSRGVKTLGMIFYFISILFANDGFMSSRGGNIYPDYESKKNVRMEKERVDIKLYRDSIDVYCKFWFYSTVENKNLSGVIVGFPNYTEGPAGRSPKLRNFKTKVNGIEVDVDVAEEIITYKNLKTGKLADPQGIVNSWFTWSVDFKYNDTTIIENWYTGTWGGGLLSRDFDYLIGTGSTWDSTIGDGRIVFDHSNLVTSGFVIGKRDSASCYPMKVTSFRDSLVYSFKNYRPPKTGVLYITFLSFWDDPFNSQKEESFKEIFENQGLKTLIKKQEDKGFNLKFMRNEIYARHGYVFKDKELQDYFKATDWYKENKEFSIDKLNRFEQNTVQAITKVEMEKL